MEIKKVSHFRQTLSHFRQLLIVSGLKIYQIQIIKKNFFPKGHKAMKRENGLSIYFVDFLNSSGDSPYFSRKWR